NLAPVTSAKNLGADMNATPAGLLTTLTRTPVPAAVATIAHAIAQQIGTPVAELIIEDHRHENLRPGAYSIAYEGASDWPYRFTVAAQNGVSTLPDGWTVEAGASWYLALYPDSPAVDGRA